MSNIRSRIARLEKANGGGNVYAEAAERVREANERFRRMRKDDRGKVGSDEKVRGWMDAAELRRRLEDDSLPANERQAYMQDLEHKTDDEVERQMIQAKLTRMHWEEVKELRRRAEEKGLSKRSRETLLRMAEGCERVMRFRDGAQTLH